MSKKISDGLKTIPNSVKQEVARASITERVRKSKDKLAEDGPALIEKSKESIKRLADIDISRILNDTLGS